jgi:hypothetical protein
MQLIGKKTLMGQSDSKTPVSTTFLRLSGGTLFLSLHTTAQALQPMHLRRSITMPQRGGLFFKPTSQHLPFMPQFSKGMRK